MAPMATVVTEDILRTIFPRIKDLVEIHDGFLDKLRDATSASPSMKLSQVLLESRKPFLMYGEYCSCITNAVDTLRGLTRKKPEFEQLVHVSKELYYQSNFINNLYSTTLSNAKNCTTEIDRHCMTFSPCPCRESSSIHCC